MNHDPYLTAYGVTVAALRDQPGDIRALFAGLTTAETRAVAEGAVLAMAQTLRDQVPAETIDLMIAAMQQLAADDVAEGQTR
ncbi:hypothetical protein [Streptomyces xanthochromogenes]|uniref:hypothetical protein n=1 Tax=Streptomyces xanthochromogenes TaxID=67384 RepID=UPI002F40596D